MIRVIESKPVARKDADNDIGYFEYTGVAADTKPTVNVANGSIFVEVDTGDVYFYNEAGETWVKQFGFQ